MASGRLPLDYADLEYYIRYRMRNERLYQPVMIKALLVAERHTATIDEILACIPGYDGSDAGHYKDILMSGPHVPLSDSGVIKSAGWLYGLQIDDTLTTTQIKKLVDLCDMKYKEFLDDAPKDAAPDPSEAAPPVDDETAGSHEESILDNVDAPRDSDSLCKGKCSIYAAKRPRDGKRYKAGQALCRLCGVWMDHKGCHFKDGMPATPGSTAWFCNCCMMRVKMAPITLALKSRARHVKRVSGSKKGAGAGPSDTTDEPIETNPVISGADWAGFAACFPEKMEDFEMKKLDAWMDENSMRKADLKDAVGVSTKKMVEHVYAEIAGRASLLIEFERIRLSLGSIPDSEYIREHSGFGIGAYRSEFGSLEQMMEEFGYVSPAPGRDGGESNLEYFNKNRARLLQALVQSLPMDRADLPRGGPDIKSAVTDVDIEHEFDTDMGSMLDLAYADAPNKISLIFEYERIKLEIGDEPTREELEIFSKFGIASYDAEFGSLGHMLERLGYDPWQRRKRPLPRKASRSAPRKFRRKNTAEVTGVARLNMLIDRSMELLKEDPSGMDIAALANALEITHDEAEQIIVRLVRIEGVSMDGGAVRWNGAQDIQRLLYEAMDAVRASPSPINLEDLAGRLGVQYNESEPLWLDLEEIGCMKLDGDMITAWNDPPGLDPRYVPADPGQDDRTTDTSDPEWDKIVPDALEVIKSNAYDIHLAYLGVSMCIRYEDLPELARRVISAGRLALSDDDNMLYDPGPPEPKGGYEDAIERLAMVLIDDYWRQQPNKKLRRRLTEEYMECRSMAQVIRNNPGLRERAVWKHVRTSMRLPERLRELENRGDLHPDPDKSLRIALFAADHYRWDGDEDTEEAVTSLAIALSEYVAKMHQDG